MIQVIKSPWKSEDRISRFWVSFFNPKRTPERMLDIPPPELTGMIDSEKKVVCRSKWTRDPSEENPIIWFWFRNRQLWSEEMWIDDLNGSMWAEWRFTESKNWGVKANDGALPSPPFEMISRIKEIKCYKYRRSKSQKVLQKLTLYKRVKFLKYWVGFRILSKVDFNYHVVTHQKWNNEVTRT